MRHLTRALLACAPTRRAGKHGLDVCDTAAGQAATGQLIEASLAFSGYAHRETPMTDTPMTAEEAKYIADELALPDFSLSEIDRAKMRETLWRYADLIDQSNMQNLHNTPDDVEPQLRAHEPRERRNGE